MDLPGWITGNSEEKKLLAAEKRDRDFQTDQLSRQSGMNPAEDNTFFAMKDAEQNNIRWLSDLSDVNAELYLRLRGFDTDPDGNVFKVSDGMCSDNFILRIKPIITAGTSKTHSHTNYDESRYCKRIRNIFDSLVDLMSETWETNGIENNPAAYTAVLEAIKTHVNNVAQRAIDDKERLHNRKIYKETLVKTENQGGPQSKGLLKAVGAQ